MVNIRPCEDRDKDQIWEIMEPVFRAGETYAFSPEISREDALRAWLTVPAATYVAVDEADNVLGTYFIKPNQSGPGSHVCNCGYIVGELARGQGVASAMCEHSCRVAVDQGFRAMQYNLVVSTNKGAVRLWQSHGFDIVATLPGAFRHPDLGFVDAHVMYRTLVP